MLPETTQPDKGELLGGWLPTSWLGEEPVPGETPISKRPRRRSGPTSFCGLKKKDPRLKEFRRRYQYLVAIAAADAKARRQSTVPFGLDNTRHLDGERYFLVLCQVLYRELACKRVSGEPMQGEDLIERLISWWSQGPLEPGHLRNAMRGTSLELEDAGEDE